MSDISWLKLRDLFPDYLIKKDSFQCLHIAFVIYSASVGDLQIKKLQFAHHRQWRSGLGSLIIRIWCASVDVCNSRMCAGMKRDRSTWRHMWACAQASLGRYTDTLTREHTFTQIHTNSSLSSQTCWPSSLTSSHLLELPPHTAGCWAATWQGTAQHASVSMKTTSLPTHPLTPILSTDKRHRVVRKAP